MIVESLRFFLADLNISLTLGLPFSLGCFEPKFRKFLAPEKGKPDISIRHHFHSPNLPKDLGKPLYRRAPWIIHRQAGSYIYFCTPDARSRSAAYRVAFLDNLSRAIEIFHPQYSPDSPPHFHALSLFPNDQVILARALPFFDGILVHAGGALWKNQGLAFLGHSGAGKSTILRLLERDVEILCDDRIAFRQRDTQMNVYGTWSHGDIPTVSSSGGPLKALFFLEKSQENRIIPLTDKREILIRLLKLVVLPMVSKDWWERVFDVLEKLVVQIPFYILRFDKSGKIKNELEGLLFKA